MKSLPEVLCPDVPLHTGCNLPKTAGDLVMIGTNHGPVFQIVHIAGPLAWVRPLANGQEGLVPLERLRLVEDAAAH
jgi:hypothetical protein